MAAVGLCSLWLAPPCTGIPSFLGGHLATKAPVAGALSSCPPGIQTRFRPAGFEEAK